MSFKTIGFVAAIAALFLVLACSSDDDAGSMQTASLSSSACDFGSLRFYPYSANASFHVVLMSDVGPGEQVAGVRHKCRSLMSRAREADVYA